MQKVAHSISSITFFSSEDIFSQKKTEDNSKCKVIYLQMNMISQINITINQVEMNISHAQCHQLAGLFCNHAGRANSQSTKMIPIPPHKCSITRLIIPKMRMITTKSKVGVLNPQQRIQRRVNSKNENLVRQESPQVLLIPIQIKMAQSFNLKKMYLMISVTLLHHLMKPSQPPRKMN